VLPDLSQKTQSAFAQLQRDGRIGPYLDTALPIPSPYIGTGPIRLVVLGQDPTIRDTQRRRLIRTALNLDRRGSLLAYLGTICESLGLDLKKHVYATNLIKNFFSIPPTDIRDIPVFALAASVWLPLLLEEIAPFASAPVITLGEPLLQIVASKGPSERVRDYWGYVPHWQSSRHSPEFRYLEPLDNRLNRTVLPFPHQPSLRKPYYRTYLPSYLRFVRRSFFAAA
jgi:hypothetical protein